MLLLEIQTMNKKSIYYVAIFITSVIAVFVIGALKLPIELVAIITFLVFMTLLAISGE